MQATPGLGWLAGRARVLSRAAASIQRASLAVVGTVRTCRVEFTPPRFGRGFLAGAFDRGLAFHRVDIEPGGAPQRLVGFDLAFLQFGALGGS